MDQIVKLSVLMSVYNESAFLFRESVNSLLCQTFRDFEVIIVCDNPSRKEEVEQIIRSFNDDRLILIWNKSNIGLALSMNKAAEVARADVFARMDADDKALPNRFQKEFDIINRGMADFVFSKYEMIDKDSNPVNKTFTDSLPYYRQEAIPQVLLYRNIIHHPTVMMRRDIFEKVRGYRDFPVSQDFDLWLRMNETGCRFYMINEPLLLYRVNYSGTSKRKWLQQQLTCHYIFKLSYQRLSKGRDSFSKEDYQRYLTQKGNGDEKVTARLKKSEHLLAVAMKKRSNGKIFQAMALRLFVFATNPILRDYYYYVIKKKILIKRVNAR